MSVGYIVVSPVLIGCCDDFPTPMGTTTSPGAWDVAMASPCPWSLRSSIHDVAMTSECAWNVALNCLGLLSAKTVSLKSQDASLTLATNSPQFWDTAAVRHLLIANGTAQPLPIST